MNYLLDTHVLLWSLLESSKLPKRVSELLINAENNVYVSTISFWEISLKFELGKLKLNKILPDQLPGIVKKSGFEFLNIDENITSSFYKLKKYGHADPFDRLLIWQAINLDLVIVTKDAEFQLYSQNGLKTFW